MKNYQVTEHEYKCPSCIMNYGVSAASYKEAAMAVYEQNYGSNPTLPCEWDSKTHRLDTQTKSYFIVSLSESLQEAYVEDAEAVEPDDAIELEHTYIAPLTDFEVN